MYDISQLPVQSVSITTEFVSSNPIHGEVYSIQHYVIKLVSDLRQVGGFLRVLRFPPLIKPPRYNWNIVESGVKHHKPKPYHIIIVFFCLFSFFLFKECGIPTFLHSRPNICCHKNSASSFQRLFKVISYISILMVGKTHP
jgi:hypothetical protein